ncbi:MAG: ergothioneine biosynthesis protein EgtB [Pigmentiphaga sp.]|nr:ergothioneine biosynthesis protein EgtB [Pigmentiphaga sp.]
MALNEALANDRSPDRRKLCEHYLNVRTATLHLAAPLSAEDQQAQSMPEASPTKWHLGHTTWFFDTLVLAPAGRAIGDAQWQYCFNSYYEAIGDRQPRAQRGLLTRPSLQEVLGYRAAVDDAMRLLIERTDPDTLRQVTATIELGLQHEQQHQELILMDIKHLLFSHPFHPAYAHPRPAGRPASANSVPAAAWMEFPGGLFEIGAEEGRGFAYDNEQPRHRVWLDAYRLHDRLISCGEWLEFMAAGGYSRPEFWLSDGWAAVKERGWTAPLYWFESQPGSWSIFTLAGDRPLDPDEPVVHVSYYEADAFARWSDARLPTEAEWELASGSALPAEAPALHPHPARCAPGLRQMTGAAWQWTASAYSPYPGFKPAAGVAAEYNGKFMSGQMVLRGGACITPEGHARATYRNFFPPDARWAFTGVRLAHDAPPASAPGPRHLHLS